MDSVMLNSLDRLRDGAVRAVVKRGLEVMSRRVGGGGEGGTCYTDRAGLDNSGAHSSHGDSGDSFVKRDWRSQGTSGQTQTGARDYPVEAGARHYPVEAGARDHIVEAGARDHSVEARARNHPVEAGARNNSVEAGARHQSVGA